MAKVIDRPKRRSSVDEGMLKVAGEIEKLLTDSGEGVWVSDEITYDSRSKAQSAVNTYKRILIEDRVLVSDRAKLGSSIFPENGNGKVGIAFALLSDADAAKVTARADKIRAARAKKKEAPKAAGRSGARK